MDPRLPAAIFAPAIEALSRLVASSGWTDVADAKPAESEYKLSFPQEKHRTLHATVATLRAELEAVAQQQSGDLRHARTGIELRPGLDGVPATQSSICDIDGEQGLLTYRGYPMQDLAANSSFLETAFLLIWGELPNREQPDAGGEEGGGLGASPPRDARGKRLAHLGCWRAPEGL